MPQSPIASDDPYLPVAYSMYSTPGAYAVLAGAGVSMGANLPTAWDIVVQIAQQLCRPMDPSRADSIDAANVEDWYVDTYQKPLTYSGILEEVAPTPHEREAVLKRFFEPRLDPNDEDAERQYNGPSTAHLAIAELMVTGTVRVVVTMNFDHLFEDALKERHIDPVVVRTDSDAAGLAPLHTIEHLIVHLHGDYRDPTSMLNTGTELSEYQPHMQALITKIVASHGLLIAGWSAEHDHALRTIIRRAHRRYYTPAWISPGNLGPRAQELANLLGARVFPDVADNAFGRLADAVGAMRRREARHPISPTVAADRIKRDLSDRRPAITAHDTLSAELARLDSLQALAIDNYHSHDAQNDYSTIVDRVDAGCAISVAAIATLAYWGDATTDRWWLPAIERWSRSIDRSGTVRLLESPLLVGVRLHYAAGVAATLAKRYDLLVTLFSAPSVTTGRRSDRTPACRTLDWHSVHGVPDDAIQAYREQLASLLAESLSVGASELDRAWQEFETLRTAAQILTQLSDSHLDELKATEQAWDSVRDLEASPERAATYIELDKARARIARLAQTQQPHVFVSDHMLTNGDQWIAPAAQRISDDPHSLVAFRSLAQASDPEPARVVAAALNGAQTYFHLLGVRQADRYMTVGVVSVVPQELWLDGSRPGAVRL